MTISALHAAIEAGDAAALDALLARGDRKALNTPDHAGLTPLMRAAASARADAGIVRALIGHGARLEQSGVDDKPDAVRLALGGGDPGKVAALAEAGADLRYITHKGYDALIDAVHGRDVARDPRLLELLKLLLEAGVRVDSVTQYNETAVRVLSRVGRFDAVALLLDAGAPRDQLAWSALHEAVSLGDVADVAAFADTDGLAAIDDWGRTPFLLAIVVGDVAKARALAERGADVFALGRGGEGAVHLAAEHHQAEALAYLLGEGMDANGADYCGRTALIAAAEAGDAPAVSLLLAHGADVAHASTSSTALSAATDTQVLRLLLAAGADEQQLTGAGARALAGLSPDEDIGALSAVSDAMFARDGTRRFGRANPEPLTSPYLIAMVRSGVNAYRARKTFQSVTTPAPVWCAQRFGQSLTLLPDGRIVQIGGEHEDFYDPDFCIYNDVIVHDGVGGVQLFGYPEAIFPPTDFHTATLLGDAIYVIGSLGYKDARQFGHTPVYRLDTRDWRFTEIATRGDAPGWIHRHRARLIAPGEIEISGGEVIASDAKKAPNGQVFVLNLDQGVWRIA